MPKSFKIIVNATTDIEEPVTLDFEGMEDVDSSVAHTVTALTDALCVAMGAVSACNEKTDEQHKGLCAEICKSVVRNSQSYLENCREHPPERTLH